MYNSANCGSCGNNVDQYFPAGWGWCNDGVPQLLQCHSATVSPADPNDRNPTNGLLQGWAPNAGNTACTVCNSYLGGYDVPDNGIDEDCDGVDATNSYARGVYIDPVNGNDSGVGKPDAPFKSFNGVLNLWFNDTTIPAKHTVIYVAAGTLTDQLSIPNGVTWASDVTGIYVIGSYVASNSATWTRSPEVVTIQRR